MTLELLERIMQVHLATSEPYRERYISQVLVFWEYLRRLGLWRNALDNPPLDRSLFTRPRLAEYVNPGIELPLEIRKRLFKYCRDHGLIYGSQDFTQMLLWEMLKENHQLDQFNLPDLFDPLLRLFERRSFAHFDSSGFYYNVNQYGVHINTVLKFITEGYAVATPLLDLSDENLDRLDEEDMNKRKDH